jgi:hypothetical protein
MHDCIRNSTPSERRLHREAQSAALRERTFALRQAGATYAGIGHELGISLERARQIVRKAERLILHPRWYDRLPQRAVGLLYARGLLDRPEHEAALALAQISARELLQTPNFGRTSLAALCAWLAGHGLKLREASPSNEGAPASQRGRPHGSDSNQPGPFPAGRNEHQAPCPYTTNES